MHHEELRELIGRMPKAELHVHLEGSIRPETFLMLAKQNHIEVPVTDLAGVRNYFKFRSFEHFMHLYGETTYVLARPDDFSRITRELAEDLVSNEVRYAEVTFTAGTHFRFKGMPFNEVMDAIADGARQAEKEQGIVLRFIIDHVRGFPIDDCMQTAEWCKAARARGVVAMGLAGYEPDRPASMYDEVLRWLQSEDVPFVPHAGEAAGPEGVWDALLYNPRRIGHGFRSAEDPELLTALTSRRIALEVCPTSNVRTGIVADFAAHPFRTLWEAGVPVTLNTDDPTMFNTSMNEEYLMAASEFGLTPDDLATTSLTAVDHSLLDQASKARLRTEFEADFAALGLTPVSA
jgi:adenosine deaminase